MPTARPIPYRLSSCPGTGDFTVHLTAADLDRLAILSGAWEELEREHTGAASRPSAGALCTGLVVYALRTTKPEELAELLWNRLVA